MKEFLVRTRLSIMMKTLIALVFGAVFAVNGFCAEIELRAVAKVYEHIPLQVLNENNGGKAEVEHFYFLDIAIFARNNEEQPLMVVTDCEVKQIRGYERFLALYTLNAVNGIYAKPSECELGVVLLNQNEQALVGKYKCKIMDKNEIPENVQVTYSCDEDISMFYDVWVGSVKADAVVDLEIKTKTGSHQ